MRMFFLFMMVLSLRVFGQNSPTPESTTSYSIVYSSEESGDVELYLTDNEVTSKIKITDHPGNDGYAAWSPDGKRIACYAYHDGRKTWSIHTMNRDGSERKRLTHAKNKWDSAPAWSPDGAKIVFARAYTDGEGVWQEELWIMNADGSEQEQIQGLTGGGAYFTNDGRIVFHAKMEASYEICIADIDGSNFTQLTTNEAKELHPEVSSDGQQIAFMSDRDGTYEIYTMNLDGSNQKRLTSNKAEYWQPSWSPDGTQLLFSSYEEDGQKHLYTINTDGSGMQRLVHNASGAAWFKAKSF